MLGPSPATKALSAPLNIDMQVIWIHDVIGAAESLVVRDPAITSVDQARKQMDGLKFLRASEQASTTYLGGNFADNLLSTAEFLKTQGEITEVSAPEVYRNGVYVDAVNKVAGQ